MKVKDIFEDVVKFESKKQKEQREASAKRKKLGQAIRDKTKEQGKKIAKLAREDSVRQRRAQIKAVK